MDEEVEAHEAPADQEGPPHEAVPAQPTPHLGHGGVRVPAPPSTGLEPENADRDQGEHGDDYDGGHLPRSINR